MGREALFELADVTLQRGGTTVLDQVTTRIPAGCCTALTGPSGAGKSSLLRLLVRLDEPDTGRVAFRGHPLAEYDVLDLRRRVQLVPQHPTLVTDQVLDEVRIGRPDLTPAEAEALLSRIGLDPDLAGRNTEGLSGGEAQRVCLARALALEPEVVLLDEPTSALDEESATAIEALVRDHVDAGGAVVLVSHQPDQIQRLAAQVIPIGNGRVELGRADVTAPTERAP